MSNENGSPVKITCFSDLLCIWAYIAQARIDELQHQFGGRIEVNFLFVPLFGDTQKRIAEGWADRGGFSAFNRHVLEVAQEFAHIEVHPDLWLKNVPASSASAHLMLKAVELATQDSALLYRTIWAFRQAFFRDCRNISEQQVQYEILQQLGIARTAVEAMIQNGRAYALLCRDLEARERHRIHGSPTFVLNEGRQKLYGNLGYRVLEANVQELLEGKLVGQASWC
ncbi:MAG: disulfide bond formation protein DsbA [Gammaproteobacteria bacterium]|nr:disulfide bond formation protein DsbA [Gammaproteobacteria bacterium]